ncbi:class I glutamine amidotransferase-like protein [Hypoxylon sp. FL1284]|nr:class I glutamine amidotransferase-like protein [Hypoxylon sp. FL1284]
MVNITTPLRIGYVLYPAFTALDVFGPLTALNLLSMTRNMTLSLISADLAPVSSDRPVASAVSQNFTEFVVPTHTLADAPELDVIIVPGGAGGVDFEATQPHVDFVRRRMDDGESGPAYVMSVCTGASLLARTGRLAGRNATTNKAAFNWVRSVEHAEDVNWIAKARWVVDGNIWTSSGVSAGTDMALAWIEHVYGRNDSENVRIQMEWNAMNQTDDPFAALYGLA